MFSRSKLLDIIREEARQKGNSHNISDFYERLFCRLKEYGLEIPVIRDYRGDITYRTDANLFIENLMFNGNYINVLMVIHSLKDMGVIIPQEILDVNVSFEEHYCRVCNKYTKNGIDVSFLEVAHTSIYENDNRATINHIAAAIESLTRIVTQSYWKSSNPPGISDCIDLCVKNSLLSGVFKSKAKDIADYRNKNGSHGTLIFRMLSKQDLLTYFVEMLDIIDDILDSI